MEEIVDYNEATEYECTDCDIKFKVVGTTFVVHNPFCPNCGEDHRTDIVG